MKKKYVSLLIGLMLLAFGGCSFAHYAAFETDEIPMFTRDINASYTPLGLIHTEAWTWGFFYYLSPVADLGTAKRKLVGKARAIGADAIVNTKSYVVTRMPIIPFILGYIEYHVSGMAVRYKE